MMAILQLCVLVLGLQAQPLPVIEVTEDDTVITQSAVLRIDPERVIADVNNNGVIQIGADGITVEFEEGSMLRGASDAALPGALRGIGIRVEGHRDVTIRNARVSGFRVGIHAEDAPGLTVDGAEIWNITRERLSSTPRAEDDTDAIDVDASRFWLARYGAGVAAVNSEDVTIRDVKVRQSQNGIILKGVRNSRVYDNDCSFLSGWGLAMSRSSGNVVSRNAFDFCVRGYSHEVYNTGQGSAGILVMGESGENTFVQNSAMYGGAGLVIRGPRESAEGGAASGNHIVIGNEFSYAATSGIQVDGAGTVEIVDNRFVDNASAGVHVRRAQAVVMNGNTLENNGRVPTGRVHGGVGVENAAMVRLTRNTFRSNAQGIDVWWGREGGLVTVAGNTFEGDTVALHAAKAEGVTGGQVPLGENTFSDVETQVKVPEGFPLVEEPPMIMEEGRPEVDAPGEREPVGAREGFAGRESIVMTEWGPWDHEEPMVRALLNTGRYHIFEVLNIHGRHVRPYVHDLFSERQAMSHAPGRWAVTFAAPWKGVIPYKLEIDHPEYERVIAGALVNTTWDVAFFPWTSGHGRVLAPMDMEAWRALAEGPAAVRIETDSIDFLFGSGGPAQLRHLPALHDAEIGRDSFGMIARTRLPMKRGVYRVRAHADDGVRVTVDGQTILEHWLLGGLSDETGAFQVEADGEIEVVVEYFKAGGRGVLILELEPAFLETIRTPRH